VASQKAPKIGDWGVDDLTEQAMRRKLDWFVDQAVEHFNPEGETHVKS